LYGSLCKRVQSVCSGLFVVGSIGEPLFVDDKSGVASDPLSSNANGIKPIEGLENMLKVETSAGDKNTTLDFESAFGEIGVYDI
jgi:hypothetical protein